MHWTSPKNKVTVEQQQFFWLNRPLKRMTVGMILAAIAFVCAALVQLQIDVSRHKRKLWLLNKENK